MSDKAIPRQGGFVFDEHRNTSRVWPVPPGSLETALKALRSLDPKLRSWIEAGHPTLNHDEHFARFGESYQATRSRKAAKDAKIETLHDQLENGT